MTATQVPTPAKRSPALVVLFWSIVSLLTLALLGMIATVVLWLVMPTWLHTWIVDRSPSFPLIYHASKRAGRINDSLAQPFSHRFPDSIIFPFLVDRLNGKDGEDRTFAAYYVDVLIDNRKNSYPPEQDLTTDLRQSVVEALLAGLERPDIQEQVAMSCALCLFHPDVPVSRMMAVWERMPDNPERDQLAIYIGVIDSPLVCDLVLRWFAERPAPAHFYALVKQTSPRASSFLIKALQDPGTPHFDELFSALKWHSPSDPAVLAEVKRLCLDRTDMKLADRALNCLAISPAGIPYLLDLRLDPTAAPLHALVDESLRKRKDGLTDDQRHQWESVRKP